MGGLLALVMRNFVPSSAMHANGVDVISALIPYSFPALLVTDALQPSAEINCRRFTKRSRKAYDLHNYRSILRSFSESLKLFILMTWFCSLVFSRAR